MDNLIVAVTPDSLSSIRKYVTEAAAVAGLGSKESCRLYLAVYEIATNIFERGKAGAYDKGMLRLQAHSDGQSLTLILEDPGEPYDPRHAPPLHHRSASLEDRLYLTLQGVDEFLYERVGDWNRHIFVMNCAVISPEDSLKSAKLADDLIRVILPIGIALSAEKNFDRLLESILIQAKSVCNADGGTLYLHEDNSLKFAIMHNDSLQFTRGGTGEKLPAIKVPLYEETTGAPNYHNIASYAALCGHSVNIPDIYQAKDFDFSGTRAFDETNNYRSISTLTTPLKDHEGEIIGVLQLLNAQDPHTGRVIPFDAYMQQLVEALASQAAVVLNNRILLERQKELLIYEHDIEIGQEIQTNFLPSELPQPPGWEIAASFRPARKVAGDFYDAFYIEGRTKVCLIIADVCDKGVGAALFMALARSLIRAFAGLNESYGGTDMKHPVELTNEYILQNHDKSNMFVTLFYGVLDLTSGQLEYVNCGHNPPVVVGSTGVKMHLKPTGPAVGLFPDIAMQVRQVCLDPGDVLFAFTDGVTEARAPDGSFFSDTRLLQLLEGPATSAVALLNRIDESLRSHISTATQFDDTTMIIARRLLVRDPEPG